MSKNLIIIIVLVSIALMLGITYFSSSSSNKEAASISPSASDQMLKTDSDRNQMIGSDKYVLYSPDAFENSISSKRILYFYANWCPTCKPVDQELMSKADQIPDGVTVYRVNYNDSETDSEEKSLAKEYGITYQHTFVEIDREGNEVQKWNGGGLAELVKRVGS